MVFRVNELHSPNVKETKIVEIMPTSDVSMRKLAFRPIIFSVSKLYPTWDTFFLQSQDFWISHTQNKDVREMMTPRGDNDSSAYLLLADLVFQRLDPSVVLIDHMAGVVAMLLVEQHRRTHLDQRLLDFRRRRRGFTASARVVVRQS